MILGRKQPPPARVRATGHAELDLFDPAAMAAAVRGVDAMLHLATRIQPLDKVDQLLDMVIARS